MCLVISPTDSKSQCWTLDPANSMFSQTFSESSPLMIRTIYCYFAWWRLLGRSILHSLSAENNSANNSFLLAEILQLWQFYHYGSLDTRKFILNKTWWDDILSNTILHWLKCLDILKTDNIQLSIHVYYWEKNSPLNVFLDHFLMVTMRSQSTPLKAALCLFVSSLLLHQSRMCGTFLFLFLAFVLSRSAHLCSLKVGPEQGGFTYLNIMLWNMQ